MGHRSGVEIREGRVRRQGRVEGKWVAGIHRIVAEKAIQAAVRGVGTRLGHNVEGSAGSPPQFRGVIAAIALEFLHGVLAYRQALAPAVAGGLATVHRDTVSSAITAVER